MSSAVPSTLEAHGPEIVSVQGGEDQASLRSLGRRRYSSHVVIRFSRGFPRPGTISLATLGADGSQLRPTSSGCIDPRGQVASAVAAT